MEQGAILRASAYMVVLFCRDYETLGYGCVFALVLLGLFAQRGRWNCISLAPNCSAQNSQGRSFFGLPPPPFCPLLRPTSGQKTSSGIDGSSQESRHFMKRVYMNIQTTQIFIWVFFRALWNTRSGSKTPHQLRTMRRADGGAVVVRGQNLTCRTRSVSQIQLGCD